MGRTILAGAAALMMALAALSGTAREAAAPPPVEIAYGEDELQRIDFWPGAGRKSPLVIFVHGGGWRRGDKQMMTGSAKLVSWQAKGYAVASVGYRLVPQAKVEQQAQDVADAVAHLHRKAADLRIDPAHIALAGHSAGAHLAALVGTDERYLQRAGLEASDLVGILALDGAAYDIPAQMASPAALQAHIYRGVFGKSLMRQQALSPALHAEAPNARAFLILHVDRIDSTAQSRLLGEALRKAGSVAVVKGFPGEGLRGHADINRRLGEPDYPVTAIVNAWLAARFAT